MSQAGMGVDLSGLPTHVTVAVGERLVIELPSYAGSGNEWSVSGNPDDVASVEVQVVPPEPPRHPTTMPVEPPPMTMATELAVVRGLAPGDTRRQLVLARSFGPPTPTAVHDFGVTVRPDP